MRKLILILLFICFGSILHAQSIQPDLTFGSIKTDDFIPVTYSLDTNAEAIYLFDVGSAYFHEADTHYEVVMQRHERIRILSKNAFSLATLILPLYNSDNDEQKIDDLQAATYNMSNGKVMVKSINQNDIFTQKYKGAKEIKLTLPDVKVGSIIEFSYIIRTPGVGLPGWDFQGKYPRLWSRYEVVNPYFFDYAVLKQGNLSFSLDSTSTFHTDYSYFSYSSHEDNTLQHTWIMKDVPAIIAEPFTNTTDNYVARIEFQLSAYKNVNGAYVGISRNWTNVCINLMNSARFGFEEDRENKMLAALAKEVTKTDTQKLEMAKHVFNYIRDTYTCTNKYAKYRSQEIKKTIQSKVGNVADLNLLLNALLVNSGLAAHPIMLSTTDNGKINYEYPTLSKYNYVICQLIVDKKQYLLDASRKYLSFGKLDDECYNGYARVINESNPQGIFISPNSLNDSIITTALLKSGDNNAVVITNMSAQPSIAIKKLLRAENNKENDKIIKDLLFSEATITDLQIKGLSGADSNVAFVYKVPLESFIDDVVYFSPLLSLQMKSNPFATNSRIHPVEMSYCKEESYQVKMEIPKGYEVDELPKPATLQADSIGGSFDYTIGLTDGTIQVDVRTKLARAVYQPEEYQSLRNFYSTVIAKEAEQIVFKKIK